jgi:hypothetical protein
MQRKTLTQVFLLAIIFIIFYLVYEKYFQNKKSVRNVKVEPNIIEVIDKKKTNLMHDIKYVSEGKNGEKYTIYSKFGQIDEEQPNLILMIEVVATINTNKGTPLKITADKATYNKINNNTEFNKNVIGTYNFHVIKSDNLNFMFDENIVTSSNNVVYKNLNTQLEADKIILDLITKDSKIFMNDKSRKVKIISLN